MLNEVTLGVSLKAYLGLSDTERWLTGVGQLTVPANLRLFVLPSYLAIGVALRVLGGTRIDIGGQDVSSEGPGPWTGEITAAALAEAGATHAEIGHSERRRLHGETDAQVAAKVSRSLAAGLTPVLCVGEATRGNVNDAAGLDRGYRWIDQDGRGRRGNVNDAAGTVRHQLSCRLAQVRPGSELLVAYEPEWAIGATEPASPGWIAAITGLIRMVAHDAGLAVRVLYGGSADRGLFSELRRVAAPGQCPDGLFLGRAGLDIFNLTAIAGELSQ
jgi:triosephosphate isomerase (TIM)